jgi:hypothetical protein
MSSLRSVFSVSKIYDGGLGFGEIFNSRVTEIISLVLKSDLEVMVHISSGKT